MVLLERKHTIFQPGTMHCRRFEFPIFKKNANFQEVIMQKTIGKIACLLP